MHGRHCASLPWVSTPDRRYADPACPLSGAKTASLRVCAPTMTGMQTNIIAACVLSDRLPRIDGCIPYIVVGRVCDQRELGPEVTGYPPDRRGGDPLLLSPSYMMSQHQGRQEHTDRCPHCSHPVSSPLGLLSWVDDVRSNRGWSCRLSAGVGLPAASRSIWSSQVLGGEAFLP